jgi:hypothetical protein
MTKFGATGNYPDGSLGPDDEGELQIGVARDSQGNVIVNFGNKGVSWLAMPPDRAIGFARLILRHAGVKKVEIEL